MILRISFGFGELVEVFIAKRCYKQMKITSNEEKRSVTGKFYFKLVS